MRFPPVALTAALLLSGLGATAAEAGAPERDAGPALLKNSIGPGAYTAMKRKRRGSKFAKPPGTSGGPPVSTLGAPAGSGTGNGATGSGAAPSGQ